MLSYALSADNKKSNFKEAIILNKKSYTNIRFPDPNYVNCAF